MHSSGPCSAIRTPPSSASSSQAGACVPPHQRGRGARQCQEAAEHARGHVGEPHCCRRSQAPKPRRGTRAIAACPCPWAAAAGEDEEEDDGQRRRGFGELTSWAEMGRSECLLCGLGEQVEELAVGSQRDGGHIASTVNTAVSRKLESWPTSSCPGDI
jgi:hypothetical protein